MINYVGVCTGWGAAGSWVIDGNFSFHLNEKKNNFFDSIFIEFIDPQPSSQYGWQGNQGNQGISTQVRSDFSSGGSPCWVPASNGELPPDAVSFHFF